MSDQPATTGRTQLTAALAALRDGDFTARLPEAGGDEAAVFNELAGMLGAFDSEARRIAREVGTEGRFGGQAVVPAARGGWASLVGDVNTMAANLTDQVRDIARTTTAVAVGDFQKPVTVGAAGEMQELKATLNVMCRQLDRLTAEVTRVCAEVADGKPGTPTEVRGVSGAWKNVTDGVNRLSVNALDGQASTA